MNFYIFSAGSRETFTAYRTKVDKLQAVVAATAVQVYAVNTTTALDAAFVQADFNYMILSAIADGFSGIAWGTQNFSASTATMPYRTHSTLFKEFAKDSNPTIDFGAASVSVKHTLGNLRLNKK